MDKDKLLRGYLKYYAHRIKEEHEWIDGLEKYNISNSELDMHYDNLLNHVICCNDKINELFPEYSD